MKYIIGVGGAGCSQAEKLSRKLKCEMLGVNYSEETFKGTDYPYSLCLEKYNKQGLPFSDKAVELAALNAREDLEETLADATKVIFVVGLGGKTGSTAAPILIDAVKNLGVHITSVATLPFVFETERRELAEQARKKLKAQSGELYVLDYADKENFPQDCSLLEYFDRVTELILERLSSELTVGKWS